MKFYMNALKKRPLFTKCATSAILLGMGDSICQMTEQSKYLAIN